MRTKACSPALAPNASRVDDFRPSNAIPNARYRSSGTLVAALLSMLVISSSRLYAAAGPGNLLANGGFEVSSSKLSSASAPGWAAYGAGYAFDTTAPHSGKQCIVCHDASELGQYGACYTLLLNQQSAQPLELTGWSRADSVDGEPDTNYSIYADITYADGTNLWGQTASFDTGTHGWQERKLLIVPAKPIRSVSIYALFRTHAGTAWFDDFTAKYPVGGSLFDGQGIAAPRLPASSKSGWFIRDVAGNSPLLPLVPGAAVLGVRSEVAQQPGRNGESVCSLRNTDQVARTLSVYYVERFDHPSIVWYDDIRSSRAARTGAEYNNLTQVSVGATGAMSLYPFGCVTGAGAGRELAIPPDLSPRVDRIVYNANSHLFFVVYDLALLPAGAVSNKDTASVGVVRCDIDPSWGFRAAASRFYSLFPGSYIVRAHEQGIWMPFTAPSTVSGLADFHFGFHEGDNSVVSDRTNGILSFRYVEPMTYWMAMPQSEPRTYAAALAQLLAAAKQTTDKSAARMASAVINSGSEDAGGRYNVSFRNTPWCDGAVWTLNPDPAITRPLGAWTKAMLNELGEPNGEIGEPDGEYLDSLEMMADVLDFRSASLDACSVPLTFPTDSARPVVPIWFSVYDAASGLSKTLHSRGKLLMANTVPWRFTSFAPLLDIMGTETNMFDSAGQWNPDSDQIMNLRRTAANHKPYLLLLNTDFTKVSSASLSLYFQECLFYDIYPSMFSVDAADAPYWQDPALYNRDRPLFVLYIPLLQELSTAGWQPVTDAAASNKSLWIERYGSNLFTVRNATSSPITTTISVDMSKLFPGRKLPVTVKDEIGHREISADMSRGSEQFPATVGPNQTLVLRLVK